MWFDRYSNFRSGSRNRTTHTNKIPSSLRSPQVVRHTNKLPNKTRIWSPLAGRAVRTGTAYRHRNEHWRAQLKGPLSPQDNQHPICTEKWFSCYWDGQVEHSMVKPNWSTSNSSSALKLNKFIDVLLLYFFNPKILCFKLKRQRRKRRVEKKLTPHPRLKSSSTLPPPEFIGFPEAYKVDGEG